MHIFDQMSLIYKLLETKISNQELYERPVI